MLVTHRIIGNRVETFRKILVHSSRISTIGVNLTTSSNRKFMEMEFLSHWSRSEIGSWVIERTDVDDIEVISFMDPMTMDTVFKIAANLKDSDATFFQLKYEIR